MVRRVWMAEGISAAIPRLEWWIAKWAELIFHYRNNIYPSITVQFSSMGAIGLAAHQSLTVVRQGLVVLEVLA